MWIPKAFFCVWFGKYMTSSMLCMYEMEIYGRNEYYIGYFCCTLYLVLLCWTHWSRRSAETGSSLLLSGTHLSFPWIPVTAVYKEACFHYEDIRLCKKIPSLCASLFKPEWSHICNSVFAYLICISLKNYLKALPSPHPTQFNVKFLPGVWRESTT